MNIQPWWSSEIFWKKTAIWVTGLSSIALILLTMDTLPKISADSKRVPDYSVINHRIDYKFDDSRNFQVPVKGQKEPLFGIELSASEAQALVSHGKITIQAKWAGYFSAQGHPWFIQGMVWREVFGVVFFSGFVILVWDLLTIGKTEIRKIEPKLIGIH